MVSRNRETNYSAKASGHGEGVARRARVAAGIAIVLVSLLLWYAVEVFLLVFAGLLVGLLLRGLSDWLSARTALSGGWSLAIKDTLGDESYRDKGRGAVWQLKRRRSRSSDGYGVVMEAGRLTWQELGRRVWAELGEDAILGRSAQLAFYFLLSLFPLLLFLTALLGYFLGAGTTIRDALMNYLSAVVPASASGLIETTPPPSSAGCPSPVLRPVHARRRGPAASSRGALARWGRGPRERGVGAGERLGGAGGWTAGGHGIGWRRPPVEKAV